MAETLNEIISKETSDAIQANFEFLVDLQALKQKHPSVFTEELENVIVTYLEKQQWQHLQECLTSSNPSTP